tara:strand:+ start:1781 stop:2089 length:309 start_codon:yes stop_codon:yes gene_type:complete
MRSKKYMKKYTPREIEEIVREDVREFLADVDWEKFNPHGVSTMVGLLKEVLTSIYWSVSSSRENKSEAIEVLYTFALTVLLDLVEDIKGIESSTDTKNKTKH